jgi:drug/metabolite transporter (DMT)-like permease
VWTEWDVVESLRSLFDNGQWLMLLAALAMAVGTILSRYVSRHVDTVVATGWHMIFGGIPLLALSVGLEPNSWQQLQSQDWAALAYATIFGSAIAYALFFDFAASGSLTSLSALTFLTPVFALLFGNLFLNETLDRLQWSGVLLTLVSIYAINQRDVWRESFWGRVIWPLPEFDPAIMLKSPDRVQNREKTLATGPNCTLPINQMPTSQTQPD